MMKDSKECPFCGNKVNLFHNTRHKRDCFMNEVELKKEALACDEFLNLWNTRTSIPVSKIKEMMVGYIDANKKMPEGKTLARTVPAIVEDLQKLIDEA